MDGDCYPAAPLRHATETSAIATAAMIPRPVSAALMIPIFSLRVKSPPSRQEPLSFQPLPERGMQPFQGVLTGPFDPPDRLLSVLSERAAQLPRPH